MNFYQNIKIWDQSYLRHLDFTQQSTRYYYYDFTTTTQQINSTAPPRWKKEEKKNIDAVVKIAAWSAHMSSIRTTIPLEIKKKINEVWNASFIAKSQQQKHHN